MKNLFAYSVIAGLMTLGVSAHVKPGDKRPKDFELPIVFQAAGPDQASIQGIVDQFRAALGDNNLNAPGPLDSGRREINWDGGGSTATSPAPTPFTGFLVTRGALFTTPGTGFVQAPVEGLAETFDNPDFVTSFRAFSPVRLFSAVNSNVTKVEFFVPGGGDIPAVTNGFGAVFTDVDQPERQTAPLWRQAAEHGRQVLRRLRSAPLHERRGGVARRREPVVLRRDLRRRQGREGGDRQRQRRARPVRREPLGRGRHGRLHLRRTQISEVS